MSRKQSPTTPQPDNPVLDLSEEDAYAHLVIVANDHATEADKRKLIRAGLLPDPTQPKQLETIDGKQAEVAKPRSRKTPPAISSDVPRVRANAIRFLLARANGVNFKAALKAAGDVAWLDIQRFRWANPQFAVVQDFVDREKAQLIAAKASDALEALIEGDATNETRNAKAVMFALERLKRDQYADPRGRSDTGGGSGKGGGIVYNITFQGAPQPNLCGVCVGMANQSPIIDVKSE